MATPRQAATSAAIDEAPEAPAEQIAGEGVGPADRVAFENDLTATERALKAQPTVVVKLAEDTPVCINGYRMLIKGKTKVSVPVQVAEILEEAGRI